MTFLDTARVYDDPSVLRQFDFVVQFIESFNDFIRACEFGVQFSIHPGRQNLGQEDFVSLLERWSGAIAVDIFKICIPV